jgi:hypothetical protein
MYMNEERKRKKYIRDFFKKCSPYAPPTYSVVLESTLEVRKTLVPKR